MAGIGNVQLSVKLTTSDVHNQRLTSTATGMASASGGYTWSPTSRSILKKEETDKQNDDNLIFLFEYRALLNSRVQTLIAQLSNALASDLDVAMSASNARWENSPKPAMNGLSTPTIADAGAARTAYNFMMGWMSTANVSEVGSAAALDGVNLPGTPPVAGYVDQGTGFTARFTGTAYQDSAGNFITPELRAGGTATLVTLENGAIDNLRITDLRGAAPTFAYTNLNSDRSEADGGVAPGHNVLDNSFDGPLGAAASNAQAKNLFQKVLFDAVSSVEYRAVLSSGLFKNLVIAASSSLPTGSQVQASFNLSFEGAQDGGLVQIKLDKMTAYYASG